MSEKNLNLENNMLKYEPGLYSQDLKTANQILENFQTNPIIAICELIILEKGEKIEGTKNNILKQAQNILHAHLNIFGDIKLIVLKDKDSSEYKNLKNLLSTPEILADMEKILKDNIHFENKNIHIIFVEDEPSYIKISQSTER